MNDDWHIYNVSYSVIFPIASGITFTDTKFRLSYDQSKFEPPPICEGN